MYQEVDPKEGTIDHQAIESKFGFSYHILRGEIMFAYMTCRPDIGYAVTTFSKFFGAPSSYHFQLLK